MLKAADIEKLKALGFDTDKLIEAVKADAEMDLAIPEGSLLKTADLEARDANTKAEGHRDGVVEGKAAGLEIAGKALAKKFNLASTVDTKKLDSVVDAVSATISTGDAGLKEQITLLQKDKETLIAEKEQAVQKSTALAFDTEIISHFPANRTPDLSDGERLMLLKNTLQFETVDGKQVAKKNGEVVRDPVTKNPLQVKDAIASVFTERKWVGAAAAGGRGGGDNSAGQTGGIKNITQAQDKYLKDNPGGSVISPEFTAFVAEAAKTTTDFNWYE